MTTPLITLPSTSILPYDTPPTTYLTSHPTINHLVACGILIHAATGRVLLIQRAAHDGFPLKWECPGGNVELDTDATILDGLCREVREETGLGVTREQIVRVVDIIEFVGREGTRWRKVSFLVVLEGEEVPRVEVNPEEHQDAVWVTEDEVLAGRCEGREVEFAYELQREVVLEALGRVRDGGVGLAGGNV